MNVKSYDGKDDATQGDMLEFPDDGYDYSKHFASEDMLPDKYRLMCTQVTNLGEKLKNPVFSGELECRMSEFDSDERELVEALRNDIDEDVNSLFSESELNVMIGKIMDSAELEPTTIEQLVWSRSRFKLSENLHRDFALQHEVERGERVSQLTEQNLRALEQSALPKFRARETEKQDVSVAAADADLESVYSDFSFCANSQRLDFDDEERDVETTSSYAKLLEFIGKPLNEDVKERRALRNSELREISCAKTLMFLKNFDEVKSNRIASSREAKKTIEKSELCKPQRIISDVKTITEENLFD